MIQPFHNPNWEVRRIAELEDVIENAFKPQIIKKDRRIEELEEEIEQLKLMDQTAERLLNEKRTYIVAVELDNIEKDKEIERLKALIMRVRTDPNLGVYITDLMREADELRKAANEHKSNQET